MELSKIKKVKLGIRSYQWWGAPKKFALQQGERKVGWLELFYDLVYVIAIAKITHHFAIHLSLYGFLDYVFFFSMIYWSWLNGSLHHDLHESEGLRTKLMTLWQILIVAALVITIGSKPDKVNFNVTIDLMVMQLFITYLWWSVGYYDRAHRRLNLPYTLFYLSAFSLMFVSLFLDHHFRRIVFFIALIFNILPPFVLAGRRKGNSTGFHLSAAMAERLGLFTIIMFGEVMAGVVNGISVLHQLSFEIWVDFGLSVMIVFTLWWIFFTMISDKKCKPGLLNSSILQLLYIPTLVALGLIAMSFRGLFEQYYFFELHFISLKETMGFSISLLLLGIYLLLYFLEYPVQYLVLKKKAKFILIGASCLFLILSLFNLQVGQTVFLIGVLIVLLATTLSLNLIWYDFQAKV